MSFIELHAKEGHPMNPEMAELLEQSIYHQIEKLSRTGAFSREPYLENTIDSMFARGTDPRFTGTFYNANAHPHLSKLRFLINKDSLPLSEIRKQAIDYIIQGQKMCAEQTMILNRAYNLAESLNELGIIQDDDGHYRQCYSIAYNAYVDSGFGPFVSYYDTNYNTIAIDQDEKMIYKNVALKEEVAVLNKTRFKPNTFAQLATLSFAHSEATWNLYPERQKFLDTHDIVALSPHANGQIAIAFYQPEEIFDFIYPLYHNSPDTELYVDVAKKLYINT